MAYSIDVSPSVETPERTFTVDRDSYTVTSIGRVVPGDLLEVTVSAPSTADYQVQLRDNDEFGYRYSDTDLTGDTTVTFDTGPVSGKDALDPRSYGAAAVDGGNVETVHPVVAIGYTVDLEAPRVAEAEVDFDVSATVSPIDSVDDVPPIQEVELAVWNADTTARTLMDYRGGETYQATASVPAGDYSAAVVVKSTEQFDADTYEPVGFSDPSPVAVEAPDNLLSPAWSVATDGRMQFSAPAVTSSRVFHGGLGSRLDARDRTSDGTRIWSLDRAGALSDSSPILDGGTVYVGSGGGVLYGLDASASSTTIRWKCPLDSAITSTPVVADGRVFAGTNDGRVHAVDAAASGTTSPTWSTSVGGPVHSALDANTNRVFVTTADGEVLGLGHDGSITWERSTPVELGAASPVSDGDGTIYVAADRFLSLDSTTGDVTGSFDGYGGSVGSTPAIADGVAYVGDETGTVYACDTSNLTSPVWQFQEIPVGVAARPAVLNSTVVVGALDGTVFVLEAGSGDWLESAVQDGPIRSPLVASDGDVFVGTDGGTLATYANVG